MTTPFSEVDVFPIDHGDIPASYVSFRASAPNSDVAPCLVVSGGFCFGSQEIGKKDRPKDQQQWLQTSETASKRLSKHLVIAFCLASHVSKQ